MSLQSGFNLPKYGGSQVGGVTTRILAMPRSGPFVKGETLTLRTDAGEKSVVFDHYDRISTPRHSRAWYYCDGFKASCFTHYLRR